MLREPSPSSVHERRRDVGVEVHKERGPMDHARVSFIGVGRIFKLSTYALFLVC
jgi:hypothetical protein